MYCRADLVLVLVRRYLVEYIKITYLSFHLGQESNEDSESKLFQVSGCYKISQGNSPSPPVLIEHSCLMTRDNKWDIDVKCRPQRLSHVQGASHQTDSWRSLKEAYPDAKIEHKHNDIEVTLPSLQEDLEIAAFGRPGKDDQKRMQMATFGGRPSQGRNWKIWVYLVDDTTTAYKVFLSFDQPATPL